MQQQIIIQGTPQNDSISLKIQEVHQLKDSLIVIAHLTSLNSKKENDETKDVVSVSTCADHELPVRYYVITRQSGFEQNPWALRSERYTALEKITDLEETLDENTLLYKRCTDLSAFSLYAAKDKSPSPQDQSVTTVTELENISLNNGCR